MDRGAHVILLTGGTGHQGGAAARHLLADGWSVRAMVRNPDKPAARLLADAGAELFVGDLQDRASVEDAVRGTYGAYSVQSLVDGPDAEILESKNLADAAFDAGLQHFVYSSVIGADRDSTRPWIAGKHAMEQYLRSLELPLTILRPVSFMENLLQQRKAILAGKLTGFEPPDAAHQWIATDDIGRFVAQAFADPEHWTGRTIEIAGDELTGPQAANAFSLAWGVPVRYEQQIPEGMPAPPAADPTAPPPRRADIQELRKIIPDLLTLAEWASLADER